EIHLKATKALASRKSSSLASGLRLSWKWISTTFLTACVSAAVGAPLVPHRVDSASEVPRFARAIRLGGDRPFLRSSSERGGDTPHLAHPKAGAQRPGFAFCASGIFLIDAA